MSDPRHTPFHAQQHGLSTGGFDLAGGQRSRRGFLAGAVGMAGAAAAATLFGPGIAGAARPRVAGRPSTSGDLESATLGILPITDVAPYFLANDLGYFEANGLAVEHQFAAGGAVILPSVESGEFDIGYSNIVSLLLFQSRGGKVKLLAGGGKTGTGDEDDYSEMWVLEDSPLETLADLSGKTVAINTLRNALEIVTRFSVEDAGGDHESIEFTEIPFPDMRAALEDGQVDAILYNEPFQAQLKLDGIARSIGKPFNVAVGGEILAYYFVKEDNADSPVATGFAAAMNEANAYAAEHPDEVRAIVSTYAEIEPDVLEAVIMPPYVAESVPASSVEKYATLMTDYGLVDELPDWEALLP